MKLFYITQFLLLIISCNAHKKQTGMSILVELDVYSGRPNPTWQLNEEERDDFIAQINLFEAQATIEYRANDALGYRGFLITVINAEKNLEEVISVHDGIITKDNKSYYDNIFLEKKLKHQAIEKGFGNLIKE